MKILKKLDEQFLVDTFGIIKVAMMDYENDPVQTTAFVNRVINDAVARIGGREWIEMCAEKVDKLLSNFAQKGIAEGLPCDKKV